MPSPLGAFILREKKRLKKSHVSAINSFKYNKVYFTGTDSLYIEKSNWSFPEEKTGIRENASRKNSICGSGNTIRSVLTPGVK